ncbi:DUF262 domain-containing protein [Streptomyces mirabilis]|uniref:DUF262 domain-containing protein n=1 Tax=Streptomyces mirabilis TaxID=68239 RepID=UPI003697931F
MSTLQTAVPLEELHKNQLNMNVGSLVSWARQGQADFDPPYQRKKVWGLRRRRLLVYSLLRGLAVGTITVNRRDSARFSAPGYERHKSPAWAVIDGKQRWQTIVMFSVGELSVPMSWWEPKALTGEFEETDDGPYVRYSQLTMRGQVAFDSSTIPYDEVSVPSIEEEERVFELINFGGVPQGEEDGDI